MKTSTFLAGALLLMSAALPAWADDMPPSIVGHWVSNGVEPQGPIFATREFEIGEGTWAVTFSAFADEGATQPLFQIEAGGVYVVGGPSATVEGAFDGIFPATHRDLTAESAGGVGMFAGMGCTLEAGVTRHLINEGCGFLPALTQAMGEYDLVAMKDGTLFFGDRAGDLTKARPTTLGAFALVKE